MDIENIRNYCREGKLRWTQHIIRRMIQRGITMNDVTEAVMAGEIIEEYPEDYPYSSCLVLGYSRNNDSVHVVCGINNEELWLITAYYPSSDKWQTDCRTRRE